MRKDLLVYAGVALASGLACWWREGGHATLAVLGESALTAALVAPSVVAAMVLAAFVPLFVRFDQVRAWLGSGSGWRGMGLAAVLGGVTPGGPFASFPIVRALAQAGADFSTLLAYLTGWCVISLNRVLVWEIPLMGPGFAALRLGVSLAMPFLVALLAQRLVRWWGDPLAHLAPRDAP